MLSAAAAADAAAEGDALVDGIARATSGANPGASGWRHSGQAVCLYPRVIVRHCVLVGASGRTALRTKERAKEREQEVREVREWA